MTYMKINLSNLPENFYVVLEPKKRQTIFKLAFARRGSLLKLAKDLNVSRGCIWRWFHGKRALRLENLRKICEITNIEINSIQKFITEIKGDTYCRHGLKISFPLKIDERWAYFAELLRTDGHVSKDLKYTEFSNVDESIVKNFIAFVKVCGIREQAIRIVPWNENATLVKISNKTFTSILHHIFEIPKGNKSSIIYIPKIIKNSNSSVIANAIRGAFDGDGFVVMRLKRVALSCKSKQYIKDLTELLDKLGIYAKFYGPDIKQRYHCIMMRRNEIKKFAKLVGFSHKKRKERLALVINSYSEKDFYNHNEAKEKIIRLIGQYRPLNRYELAKYLNRSPDTTSFHIRKLIKERKLTFVKRSKTRIYSIGGTNEDAINPCRLYKV